MDVLNIVSAVLFVTADIFAIASLLMPEWIRSSVGGETRIGLLRTCLTIHGRDMTCFTPENFRPEWVLTFLYISAGVSCIAVTVVMLIITRWRANAIKYARWLGFVAIIMFCLAAVIFPIGFNMDHIGGQPYQLPSSYHVGTSYILFVVALWVTVISELFAGKVCLPHF